jgi:cholesterol 24(S)-hydroxylase
MSDPNIKLQLGNSDIPTLFNVVLDGVLLEIYNPLISYYRDGKKYMDCAFRLREIGKHCILKRIDDLKNGRETPKDILTLIIGSTQSDETITLEELINNFVTFYGAGQETTASTLAFSLIHLLQEPEIMKKVVDEVDSVFEDEEGDEITLTGIENLVYMNAVIEEILRLYPPVSLISVIPNRDITLMNYHIPKGTQITVNYFLLLSLALP